MKQVPGGSAEGGRIATGHYKTGQESPIQQQSLCGGGERMEDEVGGSSVEDLGALCSAHNKSREAPRGCWHEKTEAGNKPGTEAVQIRPATAMELQPPGLIWHRCYHHRRTPTLR